MSHSCPVSQLWITASTRTKVALGLLGGHAHTCVIGAEPDQQDERTEEMMALLAG